MEMNFIEGTCPKCGAKTREKCNTWVYGSPIRTCGSCKTEYLDKRWREVAIDGFDPRSNNSSFYLKGFFERSNSLFWKLHHEQEESQRVEILLYQQLDLILKPLQQLIRKT